MAIPRVTCVLLTTHPQRAAFLPDALRSFRAQTYPHRELLVVNDGAPLVSRADGVRVVNLPDRGHRWTVGEKRNVGVRFAQGDLLATWDDDDVSLPARLVESVAAMEHGGLAGVFAGGMLVMDGAGVLRGACRWPAGRVQPTAMLRRGAVVLAGGYPVADYLEDYALCLALRTFGGGVRTLSDARWYVLRRHGSNITLRFGEAADTYLACALRGGGCDAGSACDTGPAQALAAVRAGPGGDDVVGA